MKTTMKLLGVMTILTVVIFLNFPASRVDAEQPQPSQSAPTHLKIKINGLSSDTFLFDADTGTNGFLNVGRDEIANTTTLDFSYTTPSPTDPEIVYFINGMGEIPNSSFTINATTANLTVTTDFPVNSCVVNLVTADYNCETGNPINFDLTWIKNGYGSIRERTQLTQTDGPVTVKFKGEFESVTAIVNGTWTGHTATNLFGNLVDSKNQTNIREVTTSANLTHN